MAIVRSMVDRRSDRALYRQLADELRRQIVSGEFSPGSDLPSEKALEQSTGTGRDAVRQSHRRTPWRGPGGDPARPTVAGARVRSSQGRAGAGLSGGSGLNANTRGARAVRPAGRRAGTRGGDGRRRHGVPGRPSGGPMLSVVRAGRCRCRQPREQLLSRPLVGLALRPRLPGAGTPTLGTAPDAMTAAVGAATLAIAPTHEADRLAVVVGGDGRSFSARAGIEGQTVPDRR